MMKLSNDEHKWIMHPYSKFRFVWDILTVSIIISTLVTIPLEFSLFNNTSKPGFVYFKAFTDVWFMLDIMLQFCTGVIAKNDRGFVCMDPAEIRAAYLKSWFVLDLLATVPFDMIAYRCSPQLGAGFRLGIRYHTVRIPNQSCGKILSELDIHRSAFNPCPEHLIVSDPRMSYPRHKCRKLHERWADSESVKASPADSTR